MKQEREELRVRGKQTATSCSRYLKWPTTQAMHTNTLTLARVAPPNCKVKQTAWRFISNPFCIFLSLTCAISRGWEKHTGHMPQIGCFHESRGCDIWSDLISSCHLLTIHFICTLNSWFWFQRNKEGSFEFLNAQILHACVCLGSVLRAGVEWGRWFCRYAFFYLSKHSCGTTIAALSRIKSVVFFYVNCSFFQINWNSVQMCLSFQQPRVRSVNVPSQTSSSSGRWSGWQGVKVASHQRTPLSDVARAATASVCGRKAPRARCDLWNKVWDLWRDHCERECWNWKCISYFSFMC